MMTTAVRRLASLLAPARRSLASAAASERKVALVGCVGWVSDDADREMHVRLLQEKLGDVEARVEATVLGRADLRDVVANADAIVALEFSAELLDPDLAAPTLLQSPGSGVDRIDMASLDALPGLTVCNAGGHETAMAEYLMLGMLAHAHDFIEASSSFHHSGSWRMSGRQGGPLHRELSSATLGLVGLGLTGRATAARAAAFGMRVLACNRTVVPHESVPGLAAPVYPLAELGAMASECDYLALTLALTPETVTLYDLSASMKGSTKSKGEVRGSLSLRRK